MHDVMHEGSAGASRPAHILRRAATLGPRGIASRVADRVRDTLYGKLPTLRLLRTAQVVRERTGKPVLTQAREIVALHRGPGRVRPVDYYAFELFDDRRYSPEARAEFVGWGPRDMSARFNDPTWQAVCDDKLVTYAMLGGLGLPYPAVRAVYHPGGRVFGAAATLRTPAELADYLRRDMPYPFFAKPAKDAYGAGASSVTGIDRGRDVLLLHDGSEVGVDDYVRSVPIRGRHLASNYDAGLIFQERVRQHAMIERLLGGRVSSLRMVVLVGDDGPHLFRVQWKVAVGRNITDHLARRSGNLKCAVEPDTGRVTLVVQGRGPKSPTDDVYPLGFNGRRIEAHPDTGERLLDVQLPDWQRAVALCLRASQAFPGLRYQAWDLSITPDGPTIFELNFAGGIVQSPGGRGLNDETFRAISERMRANV